jgi:hypothetical protein
MDYTPSQIKEILKELGIEPFKTNLIDGNQAAKIMTWRQKEELNLERKYTTTALRRRVSTGALKVAERVNIHLNLYDVRDIFELTLMPQRASATRKHSED